MTIEEYYGYQRAQAERKDSAGSVLGLGVMCWEDSTFLRAILTELRPVADFIVCGWQTFGYSGKRLSEETRKNMERELGELESDGLVDEVIKIENCVSAEFISSGTLLSETHKRNTLSSYLVSLGADVTMIIDSDEFHFADDTLTGLENLVSSDKYDAMYCNVRTFVKNTRIEHPNPGNEYCNFLSKASLQPAFLISSRKDILTDRTRTFNPACSACIQDDIYKYHLSWIRPDIQDKIDNYSQVPYLGNPDTCVRELVLSDEELLKKGYITVGNGKYSVRACSCERLDEFLEVIGKLDYK